MFLMHEPCAMALLRKTFVVITGLEGRLFCHNIFTIYCANKIIITIINSLCRIIKSYIQFNLTFDQIWGWPKSSSWTHQVTLDALQRFIEIIKLVWSPPSKCNACLLQCTKKSFLWDYPRSIVCTRSPFKRPLWNIAPFLLDHLSLDRCIPTYIISGAAQLLYHGYGCTVPVLLHTYIYY